mmetsp:Transcript_24215/g.35879  ORF Transcript_24215/g.35879 Transcript_24215/m.35879 type:complete len:118 (+) Transcript_24215:172-525(+)|eukprot:CAMPEP_0194207230 /NCGR_PEP_ID=MMETSP0156-20130528/6035_1 /TAXON_ID=33649 /ORGANISM="Thalassionema nitzschioides, Strain L26-B" /LENGTH=117 /DNA_ID=CAMNT_0038933943 /DNA_START=143 /DNA_END=496 /DNA_ORIENTATION=-
MPASLTWLIGNKAWNLLEGRLNSVWDEAPQDHCDVNDFGDENKAAMLLCFAVSVGVPPHILELMLKLMTSRHPDLLKTNSNPLRVALETNAPEQTIMILEKAGCSGVSSSPSCVMEA